MTLYTHGYTGEPVHLQSFNYLIQKFCAIQCNSICCGCRILFVKEVGYKLNRASTFNF